MKNNSFFLLILIVPLLTSCISASDHRQDVQDDTGDRMTVGKVQKEIKVGMSSEEVAQTLGSPNIVTTDEKRRESWIYDKISTDRVFSRSSGGVSALILGGAPVGGGILGGLGGGNVKKQAGASSTRQRTLTVIIKFDEESKVRDFAYNYTQF